MGMTYDKASFLAGLSAGMLLSRAHRKKQNPYLTFMSEDASEFALFLYYGEWAERNWEGTIYYSTDAGTWSVWDGTTEVRSSGGVLYLRGSGNTRISGGGYEDMGRWGLTPGKRIHCIGNIENLLDWRTVANGRHPTMADHCFKDWLPYCDSLVTPPAMPATTLAHQCYEYMYQGCTSLTTLPELPATEVMGYADMFSYCTAIKLSETQDSVYRYPFRIPASGTATSVTQWDLYDMFFGTGGTFTGTPDINTTYYTDHPPVT